MRRDLAFWKSVSPEDLFEAVASVENRTFVQGVLRALAPDPVWIDYILAHVASNQIEIRCFACWLAQELKPRTYLEVGVRRGFSMAMVAARCPEVEVYGFDSWVPGYGGVENPGPAFVQAEMRKIGYTRSIHFVEGNSHRTLPAFFGHAHASLAERLRLGWRFRQRPQTFDMLTVDGDHSLVGAYQDLLDTMPHCSVGGVVLFDDITPDLSMLDPAAVQAERRYDPYGWGDLRGVWRAVQLKFQNFRFFECVRNPPGVGLAVRLR